ncbi:hypothetical protein C3V36_00260 [Lachnospiraceae bacterium oral taxon 500]|nr:hypothetical protein C3V36_00260 [Lachnospiraceae bacterium oral taxon 500]
MGWIELCLNLKIIIYLIKYSNLRNSKLKKVYCFLLLKFQEKIVNKSKKVFDKTLSAGLGRKPAIYGKMSK